MRRLLIKSLLATAIGVLATSGRLAAQPPGPQAVGPSIQPRFSPYLNLLRPNGNAAIGYFGIVRPQIQVANQVQALQSQAANPFESITKNCEQPLVTGTPFGFQNYRYYFQNQYSAGGYSAGVTGQPGPTIGSQFIPQAGAALPTPRKR